MKSYQSLCEGLEEIALISAAAEKLLGEGRPGRTTANAMTRAGLVLLCGYFEGFIRDVIEEYIEVLNDRKVGVNDFSEPLFCTVIERFSDEFRRNSLESFDLLKSYLVNNEPAKLNSKLLSKTGGNPTVDTVESIFSGVGFNNVIDKLTIAHYEELETTFTVESQVDARLRGSIKSILSEVAGERAEEAMNAIIQVVEGKWQPKKKRRKVGYVTEIEELLKRRNRIAHGEGRQQITPLELLGHKNMVLKLAEGLQDLAADEIKKVAPEELQMWLAF